MLQLQGVEPPLHMGWTATHRNGGYTKGYTPGGVLFYTQREVGFIGKGVRRDITSCTCWGLHVGGGGSTLAWCGVYRHGVFEAAHRGVYTHGHVWGGGRR